MRLYEKYGKNLRVCFEYGEDLDIVRWSVQERVRIWMFPWPRRWVTRLKANSLMDVYEYIHLNM